MFNEPKRWNPLSGRSQVRLQHAVGVQNEIILVAGITRGNKQFSICLKPIYMALALLCIQYLTKQCLVASAPFCVSSMEEWRHGSIYFFFSIWIGLNDFANDSYLKILYVQMHLKWMKIKVHGIFFITNYCVFDQCVWKHAGHCLCMEFKK